MTKVNKLNKLFKDEELFNQALTHKSWVNENKGIRESNERLEFLGDAILEFIVSQEIYQRFPKKEEGFLTTLRASLVNTQNLAAVAKNLEVGEALFLSHGEEDGGGRKNTSLLADTLEAIIGALFLDQGMDKVTKFLEENLLSGITEKIKRPLKDAKSRLQELVQAQGKPSPKYRVVKEKGPDHVKEFKVQVQVQKEVLGEGEGRSKNEAEQKAAIKALKMLKL